MNYAIEQTSVIEPYEPMQLSNDPEHFIHGLESLKKVSRKIIPYLIGNPQSQDIQVELKNKTEYIDKEMVVLPELRSITKSRTQSDFVSLQKWEGVVTDIREDFFTARLINLTNNAPDETAEFPLEEISEDDHPLLKEGAIFYWNIGYRNKYSGQRERVSLVRFRRLPVWQKDEINAAQKEAENLLEILKME